MKLRIHSGGQTGADLAGLWVGKILGLPTGGLAPPDYQTLIGNKPALKDIFGLRAIRHERNAGVYRTRTIQNVRDSDVTLIFARNMASPGTVLTKNSCIKLVKPNFSMPDNRYEDETLRQYWGEAWDHTSDRFTAWRNALHYLVKEADRRRKLGLSDEYFIINVAGNATKRTIPEIFEFTFVGLWYMLMLYGSSLPDDENFTKNFTHIDPVELALELKDQYGEVISISQSIREVCKTIKNLHVSP